MLWLELSGAELAAGAEPQAVMENTMDKASSIAVNRFIMYLFSFFLLLRIMRCALTNTLLPEVFQE